MFVDQEALIATIHITLLKLKHFSTRGMRCFFHTMVLGSRCFFFKGVRVNTEKYLEVMFDNLEGCFETCQAMVFMEDGVPY